MASPTSETIGEPHPYQIETQPGSPKGAFEARRVRTGLYIRVDMPGVPNDAVKVTKYDETRTVTFSAKAPVPLTWTGFESPGDDVRIYGGYVVIDRHLADVDFVHHLKNGCLRLFFPGCDGSLHFLSPKSSTCTGSAGQDEEEINGDVDVDVDHDPLMAYISHDPLNPQGISLRGGSNEHINPYLLTGMKGVYEHKTVTLNNTGDQLIYIRLDVPDTSGKSTSVVENIANSIVLAAMAFKKDYYSRFDEATREYYCVLASTCQCCSYSVVKSENASGVLRVLIRKSLNLNTDPRPIVNCHIPPPPPPPPVRNRRHVRRQLVLNVVGSRNPLFRFRPTNP